MAFSYNEIWAPKAAIRSGRGLSRKFSCSLSMRHEMSSAAAAAAAASALHWAQMPHHILQIESL